MATVIASVCAACGLIVIAQSGRPSFLQGALLFVLIEVVGLTFALRYFYRTTVVRAMVSALLSCLVVPLLVVLVIQIVL